MSVYDKLRSLKEYIKDKVSSPIKSPGNNDVRKRVAASLKSVDDKLDIAEKRDTAVANLQKLSSYLHRDIVRFDAVQNELGKMSKEGIDAKAIEPVYQSLNKAYELLGNDLAHIHDVYGKGPRAVYRGGRRRGTAGDLFESAYAHAILIIGGLGLLFSSNSTITGNAVASSGNGTIIPVLITLAFTAMVFIGAYLVVRR